MTSRPAAHLIAMIGLAFTTSAYATEPSPEPPIETDDTDTSAEADASDDDDDAVSAPAAAAPTTAKPARKSFGSVLAEAEREVETASRDPYLVAAPPSGGGLGVKPAAPPTRVGWLTPTLQLQSWFTAYDQDASKFTDPGGFGDPEDDPGVKLKRARIGFSGGWRVVDFGFQMGSSAPYDGVSPAKSTSVQIVTAWARASFASKGGLTRISIGRMPIAFSREFMMSSNDLIFQDYGVSTAWLAPNYHLGLSASHNWRWLTATAGVYNSSGDIFGNGSPHLQFAGRLDAQIGGDGFRTNSEDNTIAFGAGYNYQSAPSMRTHRVAADMLLRYKGLTLFAEGEYNFVTPTDDPVYTAPEVLTKTIRRGGLIQLSYYRNLKIGAIEPAVRFSYLDNATKLRDNGDVGVLDAGMSWREPIPFVDVGAGYVHRMEFAGQPAVKNDSMRFWIGVRYPSRRYAPLDIAHLIRHAGQKRRAHLASPVAAPETSESAPTSP